MTRQNPFLAAIALFAAFSMAITACSASGNDTEGSEQQDQTGEDSNADTLHIGVAEEPTDFSPARVQQILFPYTRQVYDSLIEYNDDLEPQPQLATDWEINEAQDSVTITLRDDVTFHSGEPLTADEVAANLEYFADPETGQQMYGPMSVVQDWDVVDDTTLTVNFTQPLATLQITDLLQAWTIGDPALFTEDGSAAAGTGPFSFVEWEPGVRIELERNDDYWGETPAYSGLEYVLFDDVDSMISGFESGELDVVVKAPTLDAQRLEGSSTVLEGYPGALIHQWRLNPTAPPFDNENVRMAINYATDRETILEALYHGYSSALTLPYGENSPAYDDDLAASLTYDLERAQELLDTSGLSEDELSASISVNSNSPAAEQAAQILQASLAEVGFQLEIDLQDGATYADGILEGQFQIVFAAIGNAQKYPTRITTNSIYRMENNPVDAPDVFPEYLSAVEAANAAVDEEEQAQAFAEFNDVLVESMWVPTIGYLPYLWLVSSDVTGVSRNVDNMLQLAGAAPAN